MVKERFTKIDVFMTLMVGVVVLGLNMLVCSEYALFLIYKIKIKNILIKIYI